MTYAIQSFVCDPHSHINNEEIFLQDLPVILDNNSELLEDLEEMFPWYSMQVQIFDNTIGCYPSRKS